MVLKLINRWAQKTHLPAILLGLMYLFSPLFALAGVEVLFSPGDNINYRIIEAVNLSEGCVHIATFDFTSREIADALVNARRKGLEIRLLVDKRALEGEDSQIKHLEEIGFDIKALKGKGKGGMKNSFIIFDGRLVLVGPYHLTEDKEGYNYENALFFDDPGIVETYQNEFDRLFGKRCILKTAPKKPKDSLLSTVIKPSNSLWQEASSALPEKFPPAEDSKSLEGGVMPSAASAPSPSSEEAMTEAAAQSHAEEHTEPSGVKIAAKDKETIIEEKLPAPHPEIKDTSGKEQKVLETQPASLDTEDTTETALPVAPTASPGTFIDISFEELDKIFGIESALSEAEKNALWPNYMNRYVKWTGEVTQTLIGLIKGTRIGFRHKEGSETDVEVRFGIKKATKIMGIAEGDIITYTAKLSSFPASDTPYYSLNEGTLE